MMILHSKALLDHLSELEMEIKKIEELMDKLEIDDDREKLLKALLAKRSNPSLGQ
jgi:DNA-binding transcriptional MerR regulator